MNAAEWYLWKVEMERLHRWSAWVHWLTHGTLIIAVIILAIWR